MLTAFSFKNKIHKSYNENHPFTDIKSEMSLYSFYILFQFVLFPLNILWKTPYVGTYKINRKFLASLFYFIFIVCYYSCSHFFSLSPPLPSLTFSSPQANPHVVVHVMSIVVHRCSLVKSFTIIHPAPLLSSSSMSVLYI